MAVSPGAAPDLWAWPRGRPAGNGRDAQAGKERITMDRPLTRLLGEEERYTLHEQTLRVLEEVGVAYNTPAALDVLEGTEAVLDRDGLRARLPR